MYKDFDELSTIPSQRVDSALKNKGIRLGVYDDGLHVSVSLFLNCGCEIASATGSSEDLAFKSICRRLNKDLKQISVDDLLAEACSCNNLSEVSEHGLIHFESASQGWVRASLICSSCENPVMIVERATEDEATDELWPFVADHLREDGTAEVKCIQCRNATAPTTTSNRPIRHGMSSYGGRVSRRRSASIGIG